MNAGDKSSTALGIGQFSIEMGKAKPKILKNLNSLYQVFIPKKKTSQESFRSNELLKLNKNRSMDTTNPQYYVTFNKDSNADSKHLANIKSHINEKDKSQIINKEASKSRQHNQQQSLSQIQPKNNNLNVQQNRVFESTMQMNKGIIP